MTRDSFSMTFLKNQIMKIWEARKTRLFCPKVVNTRTNNVKRVKIADKVITTVIPETAKTSAKKGPKTILLW